MGGVPIYHLVLDEFLRLSRAEYQHKGGDAALSKSTVYFQATWIFGAHPPHP